MDRVCCFKSLSRHVFNPESLIPHPSPPPPPQHLLYLAQSWRISAPTETLFYLLPQQVKTSMDQRLKPNTSVLKYFSSDKPPQHATALYSHTESSGACVQSAGVGGLLGREGSKAGWGHSGSVCCMTNERFMVAQRRLPSRSSGLEEDTPCLVSSTLLGCLQLTPGVCHFFAEHRAHNPLLNKLIISHCFYPLLLLGGSSQEKV